MSLTQPARRTRPALLAALVLTLIALPVVVRVLDSRTTIGTGKPHLPADAPPSMTVHDVAAPGRHRHDERLRPHAPGLLPGRAGHAVLTAADGEVPQGTTVFADVPAIARLDPALRVALRLAATDAEANGVEIDVNSGWRSDAYQAALFAQGVATYGSGSEAERWVARPGTSVHEAGDAIDLGPSAATTWLADHGAAFDLCRVYANEPWHFELRPDASDGGCPAPYADPAHDPRMHR